MRISTSTVLAAVLGLSIVSGCAQKIRTNTGGADGRVASFKGEVNWPWEQATLEPKTRFRAAEYALNAGYRHFAVREYTLRPRVARSTTTVPGIGQIVGQPSWGARSYQTTTVSRTDEILEITIELVDGPRLEELRKREPDRVKDAVAEYNELGTRIEGNGFKPRSEPSPRIAPPPAPQW